MPYEINETHDPGVRSWVESANQPDADFPIQNLPFGAFARPGRDEPPRVGVAIGDHVLDVSRCHRARPFPGHAGAVADACDAPTLNALLRLGPDQWSEFRRQLSARLRADHPEVSVHRLEVEPALIPLADVELQLPIAIGDYTDFYASISHATNVGRMMRPDNPLLPNYMFVPIAYHGRASSVVVSGTPVVRPTGQVAGSEGQGPRFVASARLDYEVEVGLVIGGGNPLGRPVPISEAERHIFGLCLVNDWSARDIQQWEYQPLGPFLAKNFQTSMSPWVVTLEALEPYRIPARPRRDREPAPLLYLHDPRDQRRGGIDLELEVWLSSGDMRARGIPGMRLSASRFADMYWTPAQLVAHHTSNGCNLRPGDLLASGTVSGEARDARGCLLELTWRGTEPLTLPNGETRRFLEDGDEVTLRAYARREGFALVGLGECRGVVVSQR
jgi:fumarylacetoacetase